MASRLIIALSLSSLLLFSLLTTQSSSINDDDDEDLSFLEADDVPSPAHRHPDPDQFDFESDDVDDENDDDFGAFDDFDSPSGEKFDHEEEEEHSDPQIDEKDVVVLKEGNFSEFIEGKKYVMVEFYAPWCGHCKAMAPEYAAAATELRGNKDVALAKVDATEEGELAENYEVQGFPTVYFFVDGVHKPYPGQRTNFENKLIRVPRKLKKECRLDDLALGWSTKFLGTQVLATEGQKLIHMNNVDSKGWANRGCGFAFEVDFPDEVAGEVGDGGVAREVDSDVVGACGRVGGVGLVEGGEEEAVTGGEVVDGEGRRGGIGGGRGVNGGEKRDSIVTWIRKKTGPGIHNITTTEDAERILTSENKVVLGFLNSLLIRRA
ncbi:hypothetical protein RJ639_005040 [Escallonia herrerae]|uniref:Thioredoxin domain-containing protein n=1 Tax=Escallonia herrerae TaxID=1293975 RepID=A0AA88W2P5_9ASTE|nr:hypothetical protein RJ639_005040 [Escallonia herrerae]